MFISLTIFRVIIILYFCFFIYQALHFLVDLTKLMSYLLLCHQFIIPLKSLNKVREILKSLFRLISDVYELISCQDLNTFNYIHKNLLIFK